MSMAADAFGAAHANECVPFFLDSPEGRLFAIHHRPPATATVLGQILLVPPFNEEMNRCRSMVTLQARSFAMQGYGTLVIDLFGTGDSEGDHVDARWDIWQRNLSAARLWLDAQPGGCVALWGIRLGAVLACQVQAAWGTSIQRLILWQPVIDAKTHMTQFFRVRIAAQLDRAGLPKETTASMRAELAAGRTVEVAGYELHPSLVASIDAAGLAQGKLAPNSRVLWLENGADSSGNVSPASAAFLERWPGDYSAVDVEVFEGPAFWQVHERVVAYSAIEATSRWMAGALVAR